jgi:hypothetical protein
MKNENTKAAAAPAPAGGHTPQGRDGSPLQWLVVNPDGKLLAILDSESEAYWFTKNRGHADKAVHFKAALDYASAPSLLAERDRLREALQECINEDGALCWRGGKFAGQRLEAISNIARAALSEGGAA